MAAPPQTRETGSPDAAVYRVTNSTMAVSKAAGEAFDQFPHWQTSSHQEQEGRKSFYKALIDAGVEGAVEVGQSILRMLRRATK